jgi:phosphoribosylaminoimidazole carboxylase
VGQRIISNCFPLSDQPTLPYLCILSIQVVNILGSPSGAMKDTLETFNAAMAMTETTVHWYGKKECRAGRKMGHINLVAHSPAELDKRLMTLLKLERIEDCVQSIIQRSTPLVCVIMGSSSDLPTMQAAVDILDEFDVPCEVDIVSAHRTPMKLASYAKSASSRGIQVIVAGAGGAAHLPGMVAAMTPLPVIGVPIKTSTLNGQDSLLSIVQMPRGIPVATVAIGNATNAGLLAVRILCATRPALQDKMEEYQDRMRRMVEDTSEKLLEQGSRAFLEGMANKNSTVNV